MSFPLVYELVYKDPYSVFSHCKDQDGALFLDSALSQQGCGRYSFIAIQPFLTLSSKNGLLTKNGYTFTGNPFDLLEQELKKYPQSTLPDLPPFQGGAAGYFGYELAQHLEELPLAAGDDMQFPDMLLGFYDVVLGFDSLHQQAWVFSTGFPFQEDKARLQHAHKRLEEIRHQWDTWEEQSIKDIYCQPIEVTAHFSSQQYQAEVQKVINYILAGDIFEANLSQQFCATLPADFSSFDLYTRLRFINPAPFAAYLHFSPTIIASASPERFIKLSANQVETRPIKGTRPRGATAQEDELLSIELLQSEKDRAENVMIVDLMRNDLSRVCEDYSVQVPQLCGLESFATVHHLVSVITGKLRENLNAMDVLRATFPGGSITGAPKWRAMEIIAELEPMQRGPYCGSVGYIGFDGTMDTSIIIRTFCIQGQSIRFQAGGAVVAGSCPQEEYREVLTKAKALFKVLGSDLDDFTD